MANNEPPAGLRSFKRLNHKTYLWTPPPSAIQNNSSSSVTNQTSFPNTDGTPPDLILIGSWMNAHHGLRAHIDQLSAYCQDHSTPGEGGGLLVHGFSNGGGGQVAFLAEHYKAATGHPLPARAVILDSLPGRSRFRVGIRTLSFGLPKAWYVRWPLQLAFAVLLAVFFQIPHSLGRQTLATRLRDDLNAVVSAPRLGEDHADEADAKGLKVKKVKFTGTKHVEHMRTDPERYWGAVKGTWDVRA
ncbi:hypothetical protein V1515DRAFT_587017 [Lipomyces mesembrius]